MIEITYIHIYMLTPTSGVTQKMPSIHQNKILQIQRYFSSCNLAKGERGHRKKSICSRSIEKVLQSKSIEKKVKHAPSKIKARGKSRSKECLEKQKLSHTLAHLDQVA
jgi:hypothetical protein